VFAAVLSAGSDDTAPRALVERDEANRAAASASPAPTITTTTPAAAPTTTAPTTTRPAATTPPPIRVGEGIYRVGEDIPAGRYKVVERAGADCYWARSKGENLIDNSLAGGFPSFTARTGEDVEIGFGCPEFQRQGK
jgi:hypothetical protein